MMKNPLVSVLIPTYNRADLVERALRSALNQTYSNCEVIVIDDGSTDETREKLELYRDSIVYLHQENRGKSAALNYALAHAHGELVALLDSDDEWMLDKIELQVQALNQFPHCGFCFTDSISIGDPELEGITTFERCRKSDAGVLFGSIPNPVDDVLRGNHGIYIPTVLMRRDFLSGGQAFDEAMPVSEDTDMIFRIATKTSFAYVNRSLLKIDRTPNRGESLVERYESDETLELSCKQHMYEKWLDGETELKYKHRHIVITRLRDTHSGWADLYLLKGDYRAARASAFRAWRIMPSARLVFKFLLCACAPVLARWYFGRRLEKLRKRRRVDTISSVAAETQNL